MKVLQFKDADLTSLEKSLEHLFVPGVRIRIIALVLLHEVKTFIKL